MPYSITKNCIGCTLCAKNCPVLAIDSELKKRHTVNIRRCVSCGVCGRVCKKNAVLDGYGGLCAAVPRSKWKKPVIDTGLCSACGMCVSVCRAEALKIAPPSCRGDIHVYAILDAPQKCVACALCERECPLHAITMQDAEETAL